MRNLHIAYALSRQAPLADKGSLYALRASLYERPVNLETAKAAHAEFRRVMREAGVKVLTVRDVMAYGVGDHSARSDLLFA